MALFVGIESGSLPALPRRLTIGLLLTVSAVVLTGCESSNDEQQIVVPPLVVRGTYPAPGNPDFSDTFLSVNFDRSPGSANVSMRLQPLPAVSGSYGPTGSGRNWTWNDLELSADDGAYSWLIDAIPLPEPVVVTFGMGDSVLHPQGGGFAGFVTSADRDREDPYGTVVFALPTLSGFNPLDPASFLTAVDEAVAMAVGINTDANLETPAEYVFQFMEPNVAYVVVAVKDSNEDLNYDPTQDWWGYYRLEGEVDPELVISGVFGDREYFSNVSIRIAPPAGAGK